MPFAKEIYQKRRLALSQQMQEGIAIIPTAPERTRNSDVPFPHRPDSHFYYLTGFSEPEAVLVVIAGERPKSMLFCRERNSKEEVWTGRRLGPDGAKKELGFDETHPIKLLDRKIPTLLTGQHSLYFRIGKDNAWDTRVVGWIKEARGKKMAYASSDIKDVDMILNEMRVVKQPEEIEVMRRAAEISAKAHRRAMRVCRPGMIERELEAELAYEFRGRGGDALNAYPTIVAGGENACILHYTENNCKLNDGDLVLIDAGCELDGYASDITRTFPVNGVFSQEQKMIYEVVLAAQQAAIEQMQPGKTTRDPHIAAVHIITKGLIELGLLRGAPKQLIHDSKRVAGQVDPSKIKRKSHKGKTIGPKWFMRGTMHHRFFMHGTGHWLGMDVHDVGNYTIDEKWRTLEPGMIMTVEPGIYIAPGNRSIPKKWWGIGVRIEDDVLVTEGGYEVLSAFVPKAIDDIETLMR